MPHPDGTKALADGVRVPMGPAAPNAYLVENLDSLVAAGAGRKSELLYNEYIVYDVSQIRMKYVVVCDMGFHAGA
jgi:poly [ADP-ribose] polymerase